MNKHHAIYVPGILDDVYKIQSLALAAWRLYGVSGHVHPMPWSGSTPYEDKSRSLIKEIDNYNKQGHLVSLIGASAGASAVINAYIERSNEVVSLTYICGKINRPESVSDKTYRDNPAFKTSLKLLQSTLGRLTKEDKTKMLSFYSPRDITVPYEDTQIAGVREKALPRLSHGKAIVYSLTLGAPQLVGHIKELSRGL